MKKEDKVFSFDIFDTCLVRTCGLSRNVIYLLAKEILGLDADPIIVREFIRKRWNAEVKLYQDGVESATIDQIYNLFDVSYYTKISNEEIKRKEFEIEQKVLVPVPAMVQKIRECRKQGRVLFISDMYLPSSFLREILSKYNIIEPNEQLYVSCEHSATKRSGNLFKRVRDLEGLSFNHNWVHFGDDFINDYSTPKGLGINAIRVNSTNSCYEDLCESFSPYVNDKWLYSVFAGVLRATRLSFGEQKDGFFLTDVICGILIPFVASCIEDARRRGIKRLYFASRDAYIMYLAAKKIMPNNMDIEMKYLYLSTRTIYPSSIKDCTEKELRAFLVNILDYKPSSIMRLLGATKEDMHDVAKDIDIDATCNYNSSINDKFIHYLTRGEIKQHIVESCKKKTDLLINYLRQEGFVNEDGVKTGLVDVGWRCTSQMFLSKLIGTSPMYYYLGVIPENFHTDQMGQYKPYFLADFVKGKHPKFLECYVCKNLENTVIGYEEVENRIVPIFAEGEVSEGEASDFVLRKNIIELSAGFFSLYNTLFKDAKCLFDTISNKLMMDVLQTPSKQIVYFLSDKMWWDHYVEKQPVIRKAYISRKIINKILRKLHININQGYNYWPEACAVYTYGTLYFTIKTFVKKHILKDQIKYYLIKIKNINI